MKLHYLLSYDDYGYAALDRVIRFDSCRTKVLLLPLGGSASWLVDWLGCNISISALSTCEQYLFDFKRPMRTVSLEPGFGRNVQLEHSFAAEWQAR
ncbi:hypothetical protein V8E36_009660 [Tilletia maclaganii]